MVVLENPNIDPLLVELLVAIKTFACNGFTLSAVKTRSAKTKVVFVVLGPVALITIALYPVAPSGPFIPCKPVKNPEVLRLAPVSCHPAVGPL